MYKHITGAAAAGFLVVLGLIPGQAAVTSPSTVVSAHAVTAYVVNMFSDSITAINTASNTVITTIPSRGTSPVMIVMSPDHKIAYVLNNGYTCLFRACNHSAGFSGSVTPIVTATNTALTPVKVGNISVGMVMAPTGKTLYTLATGDNTVVPLRTAPLTALKPIRVGIRPVSIAMTPDGRYLYVVNGAWGTVSVIKTATNTVVRRFKVTSPNVVASITITPDGKTAYLINDTAGTVVPIRIATGAVLRPVKVGREPGGMAVTPDSRTAYVVNYGSNTVTPIRVATNTALRPIQVGASPTGIALSPGGKTAYVANSKWATVTIIQTSTNKTIGRIKIAHRNGYYVAITPDGHTGYVLVAGKYPGTSTIVPFRTARHQVLAPIRVGREPVAIAFAP